VRRDKRGKREKKERMSIQAGERRDTIARERDRERQRERERKTVGVRERVCV